MSVCVSVCPYVLQHAYISLSLSLCVCSFISFLRLLSFCVGHIAHSHKHFDLIKQELPGRIDINKHANNYHPSNRIQRRMRTKRTLNVEECTQRLTAALSCWTFLGANFEIGKPAAKTDAQSRRALRVTLRTWTGKSVRSMERNYIHVAYLVLESLTLAVSWWHQQNSETKWWWSHSRICAVCTHPFYALV